MIYRAKEELSMTAHHDDLHVGDKRFWAANRTWIAVFVLVIASLIALWFIIAAAGDGGDANDTNTGLGTTTSQAIHV